MKSLTTEQRENIFSLYNRFRRGEKLVGVKPLFEVDSEAVVELASLLIDDEITSIVAIDKTVPCYPIFHFESYRSTTYAIEVAVNRISVGIMKGKIFTEIETAPCLLVIAYQYLAQKGYAIPVYVGSNHEGNGQDVVTLGLAI